MALEPGTLVAKRYRVHGQLGKGGMGEVFSAENTRTGRMVAIKVLRAESKTKRTAIERFRREARAAGSINSDFVTEVLDVDDDDDHGIVLVFELLEGESLVERLKRTGPIDFDELWGIVEAVWMGLADAHAAGIIHRDLKPSNVFLEQRKNSRRVKILDFGISKLPKPISGDSLTQVGQSLGTFSFMPPEQIGKARSVDHRADIYAGATLVYQALSGMLPYKAKNILAMAELKSKSEPRSLGEVMNTPVSTELEAFIARGLARNPDHRFQTAVEALAEWRKLRTPNATSLLELAPSGTYAPAEEEAPLSEAQTLELRKLEGPSAAAVAGPPDRDDEHLQTARANEPNQAQPYLLPGVATPSNQGAGSGSPPVEETLPNTVAMTPAVTHQSDPMSQPLPHGAVHHPQSSPYAHGDPTPFLNVPTDESTPTEQSMPRVLALALGAIILMAFGFLAVAIILQLVDR